MGAKNMVVTGLWGKVFEFDYYRMSPMINIIGSLHLSARAKMKPTVLLAGSHTARVWYDGADKAYAEAYDTSKDLKILEERVRFLVHAGRASKAVDAAKALSSGDDDLPSSTNALRASRADLEAATQAGVVVTRTVGALEETVADHALTRDRSPQNRG
jgi:hypothetical protein